MTISSIHFKRVDPFFCEKHNSRNTEKQPTYLLDKNLQKSNDFMTLLPKEPEVDVDITVLHNMQLKVRKDKGCRGKAPKLRDSCWEAVINLEEHHTLADVKQVADFIHKEYHLTPISIAIHRDEGYVSSDGQVKYNYHAHIPFYTVSEGKSVMRTIGRKQLSDMQTEVANLLGMQRGQENSKATRLDHKQYRAKAKAIAEVEQKHNQELERAKLAVLEQVQPVLLKSVEEKKQLNSTAKRLQNKVLTLKAQKAIVEAERKRWKEAHDFVADEYRKLQALNKSMFTKDQLNAELQKLRDEHALRLKNALDDNTVLKNKNTELQNKLDTKPKEVIKTFEKIVEKSIQVEVPRQLTESEIEDLPRVKELNSILKKQSEELECAQGRISYLEQAYNQTLDNYSVLQNDYNKLVTDYRQLDTAYNNLKAEYNLLKRSKTNDDTSECSRVRIDTENQSENILQAYARTIGYSKSEPEQADEFDSTEKTTQTTSFFRSKRYHR